MSIMQEGMWVASSQAWEAYKTRWQVGQRVNASVDGRQSMMRILVRKLFSCELKEKYRSTSRKYSDFYSKCS